MAKFKWGPSFIDINLDILDAYAACSNSAEIVAVQNAHIEKCEAEFAAQKAAGPKGDLLVANPNRQNRNLGLPPSWSDEEEEGQESSGEADHDEDSEDDECSSHSEEGDSDEDQSPVRSTTSKIQKMRV